MKGRRPVRRGSAAPTSRVGMPWDNEKVVKVETM